MSITGPLVGMLLVGRNDGFFFVPVFLSFCCYDKIPDKKPLRKGFMSVYSSRVRAIVLGKSRPEEPQTVTSRQ